MATECVLDLKASSGTLSKRYSDESVSERFRVKLDTSSRSLPAIMALARAANPTEFPLRGQAWPAAPTYGLYADNFQFTPIGNLQKDWHITVTYLPLKPGESSVEGVSDNPLLWPKAFTWEWLEREEAVLQARNVEDFGHNSEAGVRAAGTLGPLENSARQEYAESIFRTVRRGVICVTQNVATLGDVAAVEDQYADTTNSDTVYNIGPRRYKYLSVDSPGPTSANGITYHPRIIRVAIEKTTEFECNNVGWNHWVRDGDGKKWLAAVKIKETGDDGKATETLVTPPEPVFLGQLGTYGEGQPTLKTQHWRYLTEKPYASLLI